MFRATLFYIGIYTLLFSIFSLLNILLNLQLLLLQGQLTYLHLFQVGKEASLFFLKDSNNLDIILIATGSEVGIAMEAAEILESKNINKYFRDK